MKTVFVLTINFHEKSGIKQIKKEWLNAFTAMQQSGCLLLDLKSDIYQSQFCYTDRQSIQSLLNHAISVLKDNFVNYRDEDMKLDLSNSLCSVKFEKELRQPDPLEWIPCSERMPTELDCDDTNVFIVTIKRQIDEDSKPHYRIDQVLIDSSFTTWLVRSNETVVAWFPQVISPYIPEDN